MLICPNINDPEWKELVKEEGELNAFHLFYQNGNKIPSKKISLKKLSEKQETELNTIKEYTNFKQDLIYDIRSVLENFRNSARTTENKSKIKKLEDTLKKLDSVRIKENIEVITKRASLSLKSFKSKLKNKDTDLKTLQESYSNLAPFLSLEKVFKITNMNLKDIDSDYTEDDAEAGNLSLSGQLKDIHKKISEATQDFRTKRNYLLSSEMAKNTYRIRGIYELNANQKFKRENERKNFNGTDEEYNNKKSKYVEESLAKDEDRIAIETEMYVKGLIDTNPMDVGGFTSIMLDPRAINDTLLQAGESMLSQADFLRDKQFQKARGEFIKIDDEFKRGKKGNSEEIYKDILELDEDGVPTGYVVDEVKSYTLNEIKSRYYEIGKIDSRTERMNQYKELSKKYLEGKNLIQGMKSNVLDKYIKKNVKSKYKNKQYDSVKNTKYYKALLNFMQESDNLTPYSKLKMRLPAIPKTGYEIRNKENFIKEIKDGFKEFTKLTERDLAEEGSVKSEDGTIVLKSDRFGKVKRVVNIPFRNKLDYKDQTFDVAGALLANRFASLNFKHKNDIKYSMEALSDVMAERQTNETVNSKTAITKVKNVLGVDKDDNYEEKEIKRNPGSATNVFKAYTSMVEDRLYGAGSINPMNEILGVNTHKAANTLMKFSGHRFLIGNYLGATSNLMQGKFMNYLSASGAGVLNKKNLRQGERLYWGDMNKWSADIGSKSSKSKTNLMFELFVGTDSEFGKFSDSLLKSSKFSRMLNLQTLHGLNNSAEHYIQSTLMYSVMDAIEYKGKKVHELYEVVDGELKLKEEYKDFDEFRTVKKIKEVVSKAHGNYDSENKALAQRTWMGKLAFFLRKWIIRGSLRRYRGMGTTGSSFEEIMNDRDKQHLLFFNESLEEFEEGTYASMVRFVRTLWKDSNTLKLAAYSNNWDKLTDLEKGNIREAVIEIGSYAATLIAATALYAKFDDLDDDEWTNRRIFDSIYLLKRFSSEMGFYASPDVMEKLRILETPSATFSMLKRTQQLISQFTLDSAMVITGNDAERYESGEYAGDLKLTKALSKLLNPLDGLTDQTKSKKKLQFLMNN